MTRIFLLGYMGSGKTTLGKSLARELNLSFVDLDWYMEETFCKTVGQLFEERGEEGFRLLEKQMLREVGEFENVIVSAGGGTPCFFDNMEYMNAQGITVFLDVTPETLHRRLKVAKQSRPLLKDKTDEELLDFIRQGLEKRCGFYSRAQYILKADELESCSQITDTIKQFRKLVNI